VSARATTALLAALCACATPQPPARLPNSLTSLERLATGARHALPDAQLFVPDGYQPPADGVVPLAVHFQGGLTIAEENFARMDRPGVLIASTLAGRSSAFSRPYRDPRAFGDLLAAGERALSAQLGRPLRFGRVLITSFSAGYGAVRELLKEPGIFERIEALVMADSIYASLSEGGARRPSAEQMADFVRFAQAAARGEKVFVITHTQIPTPYASTAECADWILAAVGGARAPSGAYTERGVPITAEFHRAGLHVFGFGGADAQAHVDCLWMIPELARRHVSSEGR
jgi:hypothetical protein